MKKGLSKFFGDFKDFITKGNVLDMAVGVIIGASFKDIVTSLTDNIISPILGIFGEVDFGNYKILLSGEAGTDAANYLSYGAFITAVINFLIMAFIIFLLIKAFASLQNIGKNLVKKEEAAEGTSAPTTKICPFCKSEISIEATRCPHCTSQLD